MPLDQHPIPQQITSYEFKLIGDMTIKQFGKAATGIILGFLIYGSPLFVLIRLPLAVLVAGAGLASAFIPFQDRPLEKWAIAFVRSLYSPTLFTWKKQVNTNWLDIDYSKKFDTTDKDEEDRPKKELSKVAEFISSMPGRDSGQIRLNDNEDEVKKVKKRDVLLDDIKAEEEKNRKIKETGSKIPEREVEGLQIASTEITNLKLQKEKFAATNLAEFGGIPMPDKPNVANVLVGMAFDKVGKIVPDAIVEIQDESGNSARVLKTNSLGQFRTSTPLADGSYVLITQKDGFVFDRVKLSLNNAIVYPVRIQATS